MKQVIAYVRRRKRDAVVERLRSMDVPGASLTNIDGFGLEADAQGDRSYGPQVSPYAQMLKIEVVCSDDRAPEIAQAIAEAARTGRRGDGKVFVLPVEQAIDVRTHRTGEEVV
jgi:nitrogen regulatory protein PII